MTTLYIAGPMRGIPAYNFPAFLGADEALSAVDYDTINPALRDLEGGFFPFDMNGNEDLDFIGFDLRDALAWDLDKIARECDGIAVLPNWERSMGANAEVATARALGLKVHTVEEWVAQATKPQVGDFVDAPYVSSSGILREVYDEWQSPPGGDCLVEWTSGSVAGSTLGATYSELRFAGRPKPEPTVADLYEAMLDRMAEQGKGTTVKAQGRIEWNDPEPRTVEGVREAVAEAAEVLGLPGGEVRVTSETGGQKGRKLAELATVDPLALMELAKVSGFGAQKYESFNFLKGYDWSLSANAAFRHLLLFLMGEDYDEESGLPHTAHFAWHGMALTSFLKRGIGTDDRVSAVLAGFAEALAEVAEREAA